MISATRLLSGGGVDPGRILVAGSNRLDFFRPRLRPLSASKDELAAEHGLRPDVPWVLFIGNFSACFCAADSLERIASHGYRHIAEFADLSRRALGTLLEWMETLLCDSAAQGIDFIYRPHPSEPVTEELRFLEERFANFHVVGDRAVRDWLLNTDLAFVWLSTSAVEAAFADVPVFALDLVNVPAHLQVDLVNHLPRIASAAELVSLVTAGDWGELVGEDRLFVEEIGRYYHQSNRSACEETADLVERLLDNQTGSFACRTSPSRRVLKLAKWLVREVLWRLGVLQHVKRFRGACKNHPQANAIAELEANLEAIW